MMQNHSTLESVIAAIRNKISLSDLIGRDVRLVRKGQEFLGLCPFHNEKTPSFTVNNQKNFYHCFGCGAHGNAINYVMEQRNVSFKEALELLTKEAGIPLPSFSKSNSAETQRQKDKKKDLLAVMNSASDFFQQTLKSDVSAKEAREYLARRNVSLECIERFKIGFCNGKATQHLQHLNFTSALLEEAGIAASSAPIKDRFVNRIIFPIIGLDGNIIAFGGRILSNTEKSIPKYLNSPETDVFHKGSCLYNLFSAREHAKDKSLVVVEGYMDVVAMVQHGFPQTVASLGTALTELHIHTLWRYSDHPVLCFDGDTAGLKASVRAAMRVLPILKPGKTLFFCYLPDGLDPDDLLKQKGSKAMQDCLNEAKPLSEVLWNSVIAKYIEKDGISTFTLLPEDQAGLKNELLEISGCIENLEIQRLYKNLFLDRFFALIRSFKQKSTPLSHSLNFAKKSSLSMKKKGNEEVSKKILLGIVLKTPILLEELDEAFSKINFVDPEMQNIKNWLLDRYFSHEDWTDAAMMSQCNQFLEKVGVSVLKIHAPFIFNSDVSREELLERWNDIWTCTVGSEMIKDDFDHISQDFKENFDASYWERMKMFTIGSHSV